MIERLILSELEIDVFRITAPSTFKRSEIVCRRRGLNPNQVDVLSTLGHAGVSRRDGILRIGSDIVSGFPSFIAAEENYVAPSPNHLVVGMCCSLLQVESLGSQLCSL